MEVNLSWSYLKKTIRNARDGHNLTLHEFAHLIDFADDGIAQSIPVSEGSKDHEEWKTLVEQEHSKLMKAYESGKNYSIRAYGGYESIKGNKPELFSPRDFGFLRARISIEEGMPQDLRGAEKILRG